MQREFLREEEHCYELREQYQKIEEKYLNEKNKYKLKSKKKQKIMMIPPYRRLFHIVEFSLLIAQNIKVRQIKRVEFKFAR